MNQAPTNEQVLMQVAQQFLTRADLKGGEVDNYAKCFNFIQSIVEGVNVVVPAVAWDEGRAAIKELAESKEAKKDSDVVEEDEVPPPGDEVPESELNGIECMD